MNSVLGFQYSVLRRIWSKFCLLAFVILLVSLSGSSFFLRADSLTQSHKEPRELLKVESNDLSKHRVKAQPSSFFEKRAEGWHWYESLSESLNDDNVEEKKEKNNSAAYPQTPTEKIESQRKALEQKLHAAIIEPTRENLIAYIIAQRALMDQSQRFSEEWKKVVMTTPALDETLIHPVDQNARHVYYNERSKELSKRIKALASDYGLFFFFRKNCPYCHHFAPIVKRFSQKYGWSVLAISMDGGILPEFPEARRDNGIASRLQITHVPALIAFHPKTKQLIPLAYGMVSESEIEGRVEILTRLSEKIQPDGGKK